MNFQTILDWIYSHNTLIIVFFIVSVVLAILLIVVLVLTITKIPADFFLQKKKSLISRSSGIEFLKSIIKLILKNILGLVLVFFGLLMVFLPGQGLLVIFISLVFIDFPGKWKLIRYFSRKKKIMGTMNWIRRRFGKIDLISPED